MAHQLETWKDGSASFASARQHAWHRLGTVLPASFTATQAMQHARLANWNVRKVALQTVPVIDADGVTPALDVAEHFATVRTNPVFGTPDVLGVVGRDYQPIQNEDHADLLDSLVDEAGAHFETAGSLRGGRGVFLSMKLPHTMLIGGIDPVDLYLIALNSHDGTSAFRLLVSPVRVVCANTQALAIRRARSTFSIRHTSGANGHIAEAREALGLTFKFVQAFQAEGGPDDRTDHHRRPVRRHRFAALADGVHQRAVADHPAEPVAGVEAAAAGVTDESGDPRDPVGVLSGRHRVPGSLRAHPRSER